MSVIVVVRFSVADIAKAKQALADKASELDAITAVAKKAGNLHHRFIARDGELVVVDEWPNAESFQEFFNGNDDVAAIAAAAGAQGPPDVTVYEPVEAAGTH